MSVVPFHEYACLNKKSREKRNQLGSSNKKPREKRTQLGKKKVHLRLSTEPRICLKENFPV